MRLMLSLPGWPVSAWFIMLGLDLAHRTSRAIPNLGYLSILLIVIGISFINETLIKWERRTIK